ncbi:flagellin [Roseomonas sp. NAR14]|uniref:Flagellin n=1 Tax=Roseomonas acroporae TaxID=2937791 RepID=A0A9X2BTJ4_9PROT|nr:flagellin [Roseomonas acroporae]MCK8784663.1 flagellin [Roseomonas acroporae]
MAMNSVVTNVGAQVALQSLNATQDELTATQKRISTGYRVADASDDGAAYAVAQRVRGNVAAATSANEQLGGVNGLLDTTSTGLSSISDTLNNLKSMVTKLADGTLSADQKANYAAQVKGMTDQIKSYITNSTYNGNNLLSNATAKTYKVVETADGVTYSFTNYQATANVWNNVSTASTFTQSQAASAMTATGKLTTAINNTLTTLNTFATYKSHVQAQITFNKSLIDSQNSGLGALVDADLAKESANLQALQIRQQLGTQALSIANQAPQALLKLFG